MKTADPILSPPAVASLPSVRAPLQLLTGFFFAFRICVTFVAFQGDPRLGSAFQLIVSGCLLTASVIYTLGDSNFSFKLLRRSTILRWLTAYLALTGASLLWTGAASAAVAAGYWIGMLMDVVTIALLQHGSKTFEQIDAVMKGFVAGSLVVAAIAWLSPTLPDLRIGDDEFLHPNNLGLEFALAFFLAQHLGTRSRTWNWSAMLLALSLVRTISKASIAAFFIAETIYITRDKQLTRRIKVRIVAIAVAVMAAFTGLIEAYVEKYATDGNSIETLTGRTVIWTTSIVMSLERPWFGHGIYSFRVLIPSFGKFEPWHAHNELLQQFFEFGILGVVITAGLYSSLWRAAKKTPSNTYSPLASALFLFAFTRGMADTINFGLSLPLWLFAGLAIALTPTEAHA